MTDKINKGTVLDRILGLFGRKRRVITAKDVCDNHGLYVYFESKPENSWAAFFRPKDRELSNT